MIKGLQSATAQARQLTQALNDTSKAARNVHEAFQNPSPGVTRIARQSGNGVDVGYRIVRTPVHIRGGGRANTAGFANTGGGSMFTQVGSFDTQPGSAPGPLPATQPSAGGGVSPSDSLGAKLLSVQTQQLTILQRIDAKLDAGGARDRLEGLV